MKNKKLISVIALVFILVSSLSLGLISYAKTVNNIALDKVYTDTIEGSDDKIWYTYTPEDSGTYTFISYGMGVRTEAYLFTKTVNPDGSKVYNQLAYAGPNDPDYMKNRSFNYLGVDYIHTASNFILTYHLDKGTTYYFASGYYGTTSKESSSVRLFNVEYDKEVLESVSATTQASLSAFTDGEWRYDDKGEKYYYYNFGKIQQNLTITLTYKDGTKSVGKGSDEKIDGYTIKYSQNQEENHWYAQNTPDYNGNYLTISVGTVSYDYDVQIQTSAMYSVKGIVLDYQTGEPIQNAEILMNNGVVDKTDSDGKFTFAYTSGKYQMTIRCPNFVTRISTIVVDANDLTKNDHTKNPILLVYGDMLVDNVINARDFAYCLQNGLSFNSEMINFTSRDYPEIIE